MVDFAKQVREDFINGTLVFVGTREDVADIIDTMFADESFTEHPLTFQTHPTPPYLFIGYRDAHPDWIGQEARSELFRGNIIIPWSTVTQTVNSLSNDLIGDIIAKFLRSEAYINITPTCGDDVTEMIEIIGRASDDYGVVAGIRNDEEFTGKEYIEYLYNDYFRNLFVDTNMDGELNASSACGLGTESSSIQPSIVYPISYLSIKLSDNDNSHSYTEEDFDKIFN